MELKIKIVDDNASDCKALLDMIKKWAALNAHSVNITCYTDSDQFLISCVDRLDCDILILDVLLGRESGFDVALQIQRDNPDLLFILTSSNREFAERGYKFSAFDFLSKPVEPMQLAVTLDRSVGRVSAGKCMYYIFSTDGMTKRIPINDVLYIAGAGNYLEIHAKNPQAKFLERSTFTERMSRLPNFFVKVNRSVAVNMMNVDSFTSECVFFTDSDESIPVSKSFLPDIKKAFYKVNGL